MQLRATITDVWGTPLHKVEFHQGIEVMWPVNDSRTAKLSLSIYHPACKFVRPLDRLVKIYYGPWILFHGIMLKPIWSGKQGIVEVNCHDTTLRLKHRYNRFGNEPVDKGYPMDGRGLRMLVESGVPIEPQLDRDVPNVGILWGTDTYPQQGPKPVTSPPAAGDGYWGRAERGSNVWDTIQNLLQIQGAPEVEFEPIDADFPAVGGVWNPGDMAQMHIAPRIGSDKTGQVFFQHNFGQGNADDFVYEPDGDVVRNYWVEVNPGGERNRADTKNKALSHDGASWKKYGIYGGWESAQQTYTKEGLQQRANAYVGAYAYPPDFFSVTPRSEGTNVPAFLKTYKVGDTIRAATRKGYLNKDLQGRIIKATIKQRDTSGGAQMTLDCVPTVGGAPASGGDEQDAPVA